MTNKRSIEAWLDEFNERYEIACNYLGIAQDLIPIEYLIEGKCKTADDAMHYDVVRNKIVVILSFIMNDETICKLNEIDDGFLLYATIFHEMRHYSQYAYLRDQIDGFIFNTTIMLFGACGDASNKALLERDANNFGVSCALDLLKTLNPEKEEKYKEYMDICVDCDQCDKEPELDITKVFDKDVVSRIVMDAINITQKYYRESYVLTLSMSG